MYAGVTHIQSDPEKIDETIATYKDTIVPMFGQQPGVKGLLLLVDRSTGKAISVGLWDSEESAKAYETSGAFRDGVANFVGLMQSQPVREVFEVAVMTM